MGHPFIPLMFDLRTSSLQQSPGSISIYHTCIQLNQLSGRPGIMIIIDRTVTSISNRPLVIRWEDRSQRDPSSDSVSIIPTMSRSICSAITTAVVVFWSWSHGTTFASQLPGGASACMHVVSELNSHFNVPVE
jgi:hypothetical protein